MKTWRHIALYVICGPWDVLVAYPIVLVIRLLWGEDLRWETPPYSKIHGGGPVLTCRIREGSLPVRKGRFPVGWYLHPTQGRAWGGTTLGHGIFYGPLGRGDKSEWTKTQAHEHVHVEQFEMAMLMSFVVALTVFVSLMILGHFSTAAILSWLIWTLGYLFFGMCGWISAWLRGESFYRGSQHEESAYAQDTDLRDLAAKQRE